MDRTLDLFLARLRERGIKVVRRGDEHDFKCPVHGGSKIKGTAIREGDNGKVLFSCLSGGCTYEQLCDVLEIKRSDLGDASDNPKLVPACNPRKHRKIDHNTPPEWIEAAFEASLKAIEEKPQDEKELVATHRYTDEDGKLLYEVLKYREPDGGKTFRQRRPVGDGWKWSVKDVPHVLYNLPAVTKAVAAGETVYVVEGEKDVDNLTELGLVATSCLGGAKSKPGQWKPEWSESLRDANVVILPDNDEPGKKHGEIVKAALQGVAKSVRVVELPDLPEKGDVSDWIAAGGTKEQLTEIEPEIPDVFIESFDDAAVVEYPPREEIIAPWLKQRGLAMVYAKRGVGKSLFCQTLSVGIASGTPVFDWIVPKARKVLYIDGEMDYEELVERFAGIMVGLRARPEPGMLQLLSRDRMAMLGKQLRYFAEPEMQKKLIDMVPDDVEVVVFDNLGCLFGGDENTAEGWDAIGDFLLVLRMGGKTIILVHHAGKGGDQRGTSKREDALHAEFKLTATEDEFGDERSGEFEVRCTKSRGFDKANVAPIIARMVREDGAITWDTKPVGEERLDRVIAAYNDLKREGKSPTQRAVGERTDMHHTVAGRYIRKARAMKKIDNEKDEAGNGWA